MMPFSKEERKRRPWEVKRRQPRLSVERERIVSSGRRKGRGWRVGARAGFFDVVSTALRNTLRLSAARATKLSWGRMRQRKGDGGGGEERRDRRRRKGEDGEGRADTWSVEN